MGDFILGYLLNAAWEAPLIAVAAILLLKFARLDARERCWMGIGFLALSVTLPAVDPRLMSSFTPPALPEAVSYAVAPDLPAAPTTQAVPDIAMQTPAPVVAAATTPAQDRLTLPAVVGMGLLWAFLAAVVVGLARLAVGLIAASRLIRRSRPIELAPAVLAPMRRLATAHGRRAVPVRVSDSLTVPAVVGGWFPVILAPADFERHGQEAMTAALLHECAHVVRGDYAINLACEALTLPLIWHPAVHLIKSHIQADREAACDRLAAGQMPAKRYAACLVALADAMSPAPRRALAMQSLFGRGELERRVRMLLQTPMGEVRGRLLRAALVGGPVLGAVVTSGLIFHVEPAMAQAAQVSQAAASAPALAGAPPQSPQLPAVAASIPPSPTKPKARRMVERHVHRWTSDDGKTHLVIAEDEKDLTPADQAKLDAEVTQAKAEAEKARAYTHSPEFHAMIVRSQQDESRADVAEARAEADAARAEGRAEANAAKAEARAEADEARTEARASGQELRAQLHDMVERQRTLIANNRVEVAAQVQRVKEILHDPDVQKALRQARAAGPEVSRALDRLDRELDRSLDHIPAPPKPPKPPAPPEPPAPPPPPETE